MLPSPLSSSSAPSSPVSLSSAPCSPGVPSGNWGELLALYFVHDILTGHKEKDTLDVYKFLGIDDRDTPNKEKALDMYSQTLESIEGFRNTLSKRFRHFHFVASVFVFIGFCLMCMYIILYTKNDTVLSDPQPVTSSLASYFQSIHPATLQHSIRICWYTVACVCLIMMVLVYFLRKDVIHLTQTPTDKTANIVYTHEMNVKKQDLTSFTQRVEMYIGVLFLIMLIMTFHYNPYKDRVSARGLIKKFVYIFFGSFLASLWIFTCRSDFSLRVALGVCGLAAGTTVALNYFMDSMGIHPPKVTSTELYSGSESPEDQRIRFGILSLEPQTFGFLILLIRVIMSLSVIGIVCIVGYILILGLVTTGVTPQFRRDISQLYTNSFISNRLRLKNNEGQWYVMPCIEITGFVVLSTIFSLLMVNTVTPFTRQRWISTLSSTLVTVGQFMCIYIIYNTIGWYDKFQHIPTTPDIREPQQHKDFHPVSPSLLFPFISLLMITLLP